MSVEQADASYHAAFMYGERRNDRLTWHDRFARCPECSHATVGLSRPYGINHADGCTMPRLLPEEGAKPTALAEGGTIPALDPTTDDQPKEAPE